MKVELAILNYDGRRHLEHLLPTAIREAESYGLGCRVVVVDNRSPNDDAPWVRETYPGVDVWVAPRNEYLFSYNEYAKQSTAEILVFLNNDLKLCKNFLSPLLKHFSSPDVFAVSATSRDWEDTKYTFGPIQLRNHHGEYYWLPNFKKQETCNTFFASGGFMAVERKKFLEIHGFDRLYFPAYCEDLDLCFRGWRKGWRCILEPRSIVLHREHGSWKSATGNKVERLMLRNKLLFEWSSLPKSCGVFERLSFCLFKALRNFSKGSFWREITLLQTAFEWKRLKKQVTHPRATFHDLEKIDRFLIEKSSLT